MFSQILLSTNGCVSRKRGREKGKGEKEEEEVRAYMYLIIVTKIVGSDICIVFIVWQVLS